MQHRTYGTPGFNAQYVKRGLAGAMKNQFTVGTDMSWQHIDDYRHPNLGLAKEGAGFLSNQAIDQRGIGLYAMDRVDFNPRWSGTISVRWDQVHNSLTDNLKLNGVDLTGDANFSKATARAGIAFNPRRDFGLFASFGEGFLPPATEELANNPDAMGGFNTRLVPATSYGEEFGVRGNVSVFSYDVTFFHLATDHDFGRYRVASRPLETFYGNLGTSRRYGVETSLGYYPTPSLALRGAYTFSDFVYTSVTSLWGTFNDKVMPNAPRHQVAFDAEYKVNGHWVVGENFFGQSSQFIDQTNATSAKGFFLFNPRVGYQWVGNNYRGEVMLSARNLLGQHYIAFTEPDPDGNSYQPGATREAFLGVRIFFGGK